MADGTASIDGSPPATGWPVLAAVGLAVSELALFAGNVPVAAAGLVLLGGGLAGVVAEAGYGETPAGPMLAVGGLFVTVGGGLWTVRAPSFALGAIARAPWTDGIARRGLAIVVAGCLLLALGAVARTRWFGDA